MIHATKTVLCIFITWSLVTFFIFIYSIGILISYYCNTAATKWLHIILYKVIMISEYFCISIISQLGIVVVSLFVVPYVVNVSFHIVRKHLNAKLSCYMGIEGLSTVSFVLHHFAMPLPFQRFIYIHFVPDPPRNLLLISLETFASGRKAMAAFKSVNSPVLMSPKWLNPCHLTIMLLSLQRMKSKCHCVWRTSKFHVTLVCALELHCEIWNEFLYIGSKIHKCSLQVNKTSHLVIRNFFNG